MSAPTHITHIGILQAICKGKVNCFFKKKQVFESFNLKYVIKHIPN